MNINVNSFCMDDIFVAIEHTEGKKKKNKDLKTKKGSWIPKKDRFDDPPFDMDKTKKAPYVIG